MTLRQIDLPTQSAIDQADAARWRWFRANCALVRDPLFGAEFRVPDTGPRIDVDIEDLAIVPAYLDAMADDQIAGGQP